MRLIPVSWLAASMSTDPSSSSPSKSSSVGKGTSSPNDPWPLVLPTPFCAIGDGAAEAAGTVAGDVAGAVVRLLRAAAWCVAGGDTCDAVYWPAGYCAGGVAGGVAPATGGAAGCWYAAPGGVTAGAGGAAGVTACGAAGC